MSNDRTLIKKFFFAIRFVLCFLHTLNTRNFYSLITDFIDV